MGNRKTLQELTFKDNFMFAAVMIDADNCKEVLECTLGFPIERVEVSTEKSLIYHPEYKGVRLDVYAKDPDDRHFNVEMQVADREIIKRARYYHSQMDMEVLSSGLEYEKLPECYVIFICDFDPIGLGLYRYTGRVQLVEAPEYLYNDGTHTILLSTKGSNKDEVPEQLVKFLKYVGAGLEESTADYGDKLVERLQNTVVKVKASREMENRYMLLEEMMKDEYSAGKAEGIELGKAEGERGAIRMLISGLGELTPEQNAKLDAITDSKILNDLLKNVAGAKSLEEVVALLASL